MTWQSLASRLEEVRAVGRLLPTLPRMAPFSSYSPARLLAERAAREGSQGSQLGLAFEERRYTWGEIDARVNRTAHWLRETGVGPGDVVALLMDNRPELLFALTALSRLRAVAALINTNISGPGLVHAIRVAGCKQVVVGAEHVEKLRQVLPQLTGISEQQVWVQADGEATGPAELPSVNEAVARCSEARLADLGRAKVDEPSAYIYTSGTTGLPKAAIITNARLIGAGALFGRVLLDLGPHDVIYITLPLYHSNAIFGGWMAALTTGAAMALRRRFSASRFWEDVRRFDATAFVYIGELCRYLLNQPPSPQDGEHRVRVITGNGLRPDIWEAFQQRFRVPLIREFYGATEGNAVLVNLSGRAGMVGRLLPGQALLRCDPQTGEPVRNGEGRCERLGVGETGLFVAKVNELLKFDGYVDRKASAKKLLRDVFAPGDAWFDTGDLLTLHEGGWLSFADRVGDTFRWKGENVSTNEVAEVLNTAPGVLESNVYGVQVPGADGRAGMASLRHDERFSLEAFARHVQEKLPVYQRPYFVRLQQEMRITGTFKHQKVDYRKEGFDPAKVADPLYFLDGGHYVTLDAELYEGIQSGRVALR